MKLAFDFAVAQAFGVHKALVMAWVEKTGAEPKPFDEIVKSFSFWKSETVYRVFEALKQEDMVDVKSYADNTISCHLNADWVASWQLQHPDFFTATLGNDTSVKPINAVVASPSFVQAGATTPVAPTLPTQFNSDVIADNAVMNHLRRFVSDDNLVFKKLETLSNDFSAVSHIAVDCGLEASQVEPLFKRFLTYVASHASKFYNADLRAYWANWVSNEVSRKSTGSTHSAGRSGKQTTLESVNRHAGDTWARNIMGSNTHK